MGVDYSTTVGYGIAIDDRYLPDALKAIADGEWVDEKHIVLWLQENGFVHIAYDKVGDWMSGPTYIFFHLPRTHIHGGLYDMEGVHKFDNIKLANEESAEFNKLQRLLNLDEWPTWIVSFNVS